MAMHVYHSEIKLRTKGFADCLDITGHLERLLQKSGVRHGLLTVMVSGSTGAITTIEYEPGAVSDLKAALERIAPMDMEYDHNLRWGDGNGFAHVRAALMKPSVSIPIHDGRLCLGTWQQVVVLDFDNRPRNRSLVVHILGGNSEER